MSGEKRRGARRWWHGALMAAVVAGCSAGVSYAATINITGTQTTTVGNGQHDNGNTINVSGTIDIKDGTHPADAISVGNGNTIVISGTVQNHANSSTGDLFGTGPNTIEFGEKNTITISGSVNKLGKSHNGESINAHGFSNVITVEKGGRVYSTQESSAIWFQNTGTTTNMERNQIINYGTIERQGGADNVIGASKAGLGLVVHNYGTIIGNLGFGSGSNDLHLYSGSEVSGTITGSDPTKNTNTLTLNGAQSSVFNRQITNFTHLVKDGTGGWTYLAQVGQFKDLKVKKGFLSFTPGDPQNFAGDITIDDGTLRINNTDPTSLRGNLALTQSTSRLEGVGYIGPGLGKTITNNGTISPGIMDPRSTDHTPAGALNLKGNYTAGVGATIEIHSVLESDGSKTGTLNIKGDYIASGNKTTVVVKNHNGHGNDTVHGIDIINFDGATPGKGEFVLKPDFVYNGINVVVAGRYGYYMHKDKDGAAPDGNIYLSTMHTEVEPEYHPDGTLTGGGRPLLHGGKPLPTGQRVTNPAAPLYEALPQVMLRFNRLTSMQERVGKRNWASFSNDPCADPCAAPADGVSERWGMYTMVEGSIGKITPDKATYKTSYDHKYYRANIGLEGPLAKFGSCGTLVGGFRGFMGRGWADIDSGHGHGKVTMDTWGAGSNITWYGANGFYAEAQAQISFYNTDIDSHILTNKGQVRGNDGWGWAAGLEAGKRFDLANGWGITPSAQLFYNRVHFDRFKDAQGTPVAIDDGDSLLGRIGVAVEKDFEFAGACGDVRRLHTYGGVNAWHDFRGDTSVKVGLNDADMDKTTENRLWFGANVGATYSWGNDKYAVYGELGARGSYKNIRHNYVLTGNVGFRYSF